MVKILSRDFGPLETLHPAKHDPTEVGFNKYQNPPQYNILKQIDIKMAQPHLYINVPCPMLLVQWQEHQKRGEVCHKK